MERKVRVGIDVGGTHTKAVILDNKDYSLIGKASVKTTHDSFNGVADGVLECLELCMDRYDIDVSQLVFISHSTTQATNALLEGDIAKVACITSSKTWFEGLIVRFQTAFKTLPLNYDKKIQVVSEHINKKDFNQDKVDEVLNCFRQEGVEVVVSSTSFGVDDPSAEIQLSKHIESRGFYSSRASTISKMYGFARRTKTALINASIMPKMLRTAQKMQERLKELKIDIPLMIMRGDGGLMDVEEMKERPALTMLSGPAASVMGSLMYLQASNGIYFEVGGTSTNIGVIKNGRPAIDYARIGKLHSFISSLDVEVIGVGGGSMVRVHNKKVVDVGPRSAHIAGYEYASFTDSNEIVHPKLKFFSPLKGDPNDYVAIELASGKRITLTTTCAANALGLIEKEHFAYGNQESVRKAFEPLAQYMGLSVDQVALSMLDKAYDKINRVIQSYIKKYKLESSRLDLVGVGGGAASLIIYCAKKLNMNYDIPENAEVISSIGVALAMVQDIVERVLPNPSKADLASIKEEAISLALDSGASKDTINVHITIDNNTQKVRAIARGSNEVVAQDINQVFNEEILREKASKDLGKDVTLVANTDNYYVYTDDETHCVFDTKGFNRLQSSKVHLIASSCLDYKDAVKAIFEQAAVYSSDVILRPNFYLCIGPKFCDFSSDNLEHLNMLMDLEIGTYEGKVLVVGVSS